MGQVFDLYGKLLKTTSIESSLTIDVSSLRSGIYLLKLMDASGKEIVTRKMVKL